jgi:hypothetical protein
MNNPLNEISQVYLSQVDESYKPLKDKMLDKARLQDDPVKASALRTAVDVDDIKKKPRNTVFKKKKQLHMGEDSDRDKKVAEGYSNWRVDLQELVVGNPPPAAKDEDIATNSTPKTDTKAREKIKERPVNNKVKINPVMRESFEALGGEVLEVVDLTEERAKTREEARRKLEANRKAIEAGRPEDSPYGKHLRKKLKSPSEYGKDPWSTHPNDAKVHAKEETELDERSLTDGEKEMGTLFSNDRGVNPLVAVLVSYSTFPLLSKGFVTTVSEECFNSNTGGLLVYLIEGSIKTFCNTGYFFYSEF